MSDGPQDEDFALPREEPKGPQNVAGQMGSSGGVGRNDDGIHNGEQPIDPGRFTRNIDDSVQPLGAADELPPQKQPVVGLPGDPGPLPGEELTPEEELGIRKALLKHAMGDESASPSDRLAATVQLSRIEQMEEHGRTPEEILAELDKDPVLETELERAAEESPGDAPAINNAIEALQGREPIESVIGKLPDGMVTLPVDIEEPGEPHAPSEPGPLADLIRDKGEFSTMPIPKSDGPGGMS